MKGFTVSEETTLKKFTDSVYPQGSFYLRQLLKKKDVKVNGKRVGADVKVYRGDRVEFYTTPSQEQKSAFVIVYEDENVLVVDKESGVNSEAVYYTLSAERECYFIHRLDRNTEGLLIFALNKASEAELLNIFKKGEVDKYYQTVVSGRVPEDHAVLSAYLIKNPEHATVKIYDEPLGEKIITEYFVEKRSGELTFLKIKLHTGKTHQIRAHLAHIGCPVLGDGKYGNKQINEKYNKTRQCLLSAELKFKTSGRLAYLNDIPLKSSRTIQIEE